ncbi:4-diphosphocytidyl-2C-methyl-D-erythritol kinase [Candidatus Magnetoovum chiemensis]|nr:4-diphosphocytidyl-2C-methyl-D-erythritol kinase [Candidatus Magnetoovum chiemensis]
MQAPAKINWFLYVLGKRSDRFHDIISILNAISLFDTITLNSSSQIEITTNTKIKTEDNLIYKAVKMLKERTGVKTGVHVHLKKEIPIGGGLGGGSADCAFTLTGLNKLWKLELTNGELRDIGALLGSDVPFFIDDRAAFVYGRGELIKPIKLNRSYDLLVIQPAFSISAAEAYSKVKEYSSGLYDYNEMLSRFVDALNGGDFNALKALMINDLQKAVIDDYPELLEIERSLYDNGALVSMLSGSGSCMFGVFNDSDSASCARDSICAMNKNWKVYAVKTLI